MNIIKKIGSFLAIFLGLFVILTLFPVLLIITIDLAINGNWLLLVGEKWHWYNYLFSHHGPAMLYAQHSPLWLLYSFIPSIIASVCLMFEKIK